MNQIKNFTESFKNKKLNLKFDKNFFTSIAYIILLCVGYFLIHFLYVEFNSGIKFSNSLISVELSLITQLLSNYAYEIFLLKTLKTICIVLSLIYFVLFNIRDVVFSNSRTKNFTKYLSIVLLLFLMYIFIITFRIQGSVSYLSFYTKSIAKCQYKYLIELPNFNASDGIEELMVFNSTKSLGKDDHEDMVKYLRSNSSFVDLYVGNSTQRSIIALDETYLEVRMLSATERNSIKALNSSLFYIDNFGLISSLILLIALLVIIYQIKQLYLVQGEFDYYFFDFNE